MTQSADLKSKLMWQDEKKRREFSRDELISAYVSAGGKSPGNGSQVRCLVHDDRGRPNAAIQQTPEGKWYVKCFKCNDVAQDVWELLARGSGRSIEEVLREESAGFVKDPNYKAAKISPEAKPDAAAKGAGYPSARDFRDNALKYYRKECNLPELKVDAEYPYFTRSGEQYADYVVFRFIDPATGIKKFPQCFKSREDSRWRKGTPPGEYLTETDGLLPLFDRKEVLKNQNIVILEGEKCVAEFKVLGIEGFAATTTAMGADKSSRTYLGDLENKNVWLFRDNDESGAKYIEEIKMRLLEMENPPEINIVQVEDFELPVKGDLVDYLSAPEFKTKEDKQIAVMTALKFAKNISILSGFDDEMEEIISGEYEHIRFNTLPAFSKNTQALIPRTITVFCGNPGSGKSFLLLEEAWRWHLAGRSVEILMLEEDLKYWQRRTLAQMAGIEGLTNIEWIRDHENIYREARKTYGEELKSFSRCITTAPDKTPTLDWVGDWMVSKIKKETELVMVDPVTAALVSKEGWIDDFKFLFKVKAALDRSKKSRGILDTHPRLDQMKGGKSTLAGLAGGSAYPRFAQTVAFLMRSEKIEDSTVTLPGDSLLNVKHYHRIEIRKARNGKGGGNLAVLQDPKSLCFTELGEIIDD